MEGTAVVLHMGALTRYLVAERGEGRFVAHLLLYSGDLLVHPRYM
jgi:hypothetical protein